MKGAVARPNGKWSSPGKLGGGTSAVLREDFNVSCEMSDVHRTSHS